MAGNTDKDKLRIQAQRCLQRGQIDKAVQTFKKLLQLDPSDRAATLKLADLHARQNKTVEAIRLYLQVAQAHDDDGFAHKAIAVYKQILAIESDTTDAHRALSRLYSKVGLPSESAHHAQKLSQSYLACDDLQGAIDAAQALVDVCPEDIDAVVRLAHLQAKGGRRRGALQTLQERLDQLPESADRQADTLRDALLLLDPDNYRLRLDLVERDLSEHQPHQALRKLKFAYKKNPDDIDVLDRMARAFEQLADHDKALWVLQEVVRLACAQENIAKAVKVAKHMLVLQPQHGYAQKFLQSQQVQSMQWTSGTIGKKFVPHDDATHGKKKNQEEFDESMLVNVRVYMRHNKLDIAQRFLSELERRYPKQKSVQQARIYLDRKRASAHTAAESAPCSDTDKQQQTTTADMALPVQTQQDKTSAHDMQTAAISSVDLDAVMQASLQEDNVIQTLPQTVNTGLSQAREHIARGLYDAAIVVLKELSDEHTVVAQSYILQGICYRNLNELGSALYAFQQAVSTPDLTAEQRACANYEMGCLLAHMEYYNEACRSFDLACQAVPDYADARQRLQLAKNGSSMAFDMDISRLSDVSTQEIAFY